MRKVARTLTWAYRARLLGIRGDTETTVARVLSIDSLDKSTRVEAAAAAVAVGQARTVGTADSFLTEVFAVEAGDARPPLGLDPATYRNQGKVRDAFATILARPRGQWLTAARMVAQSEPMWSARTALRDAMVEQGAAGWTRLADVDPCPFCRSLADGTVLPAGVDMKQHPGCSCVQQPLLR